MSWPLAILAKGDESWSFNTQSYRGRSVND